MNKKELRAYMARHGDTCQSLAEALGLSTSTFSDKINGHSCFRQTEIQIIIDRYELTAEEVMRIFFALDVS